MAPRWGGVGPRVSAGNPLPRCPFNRPSPPPPLRAFAVSAAQIGSGQGESQLVPERLDVPRQRGAGSAPREGLQGLPPPAAALPPAAAAVPFPHPEEQLEPRGVTLPRRERCHRTRAEVTAGRPADGKSPLLPHRKAARTGRAVPGRRAGRGTPWDPSLAARPYRPGSSHPRVGSEPPAGSAFRKAAPGRARERAAGYGSCPAPRRGSRPRVNSLEVTRARRASRVARRLSSPAPRTRSMSLAAKPTRTHPTARAPQPAATPIRARTQGRTCRRAPRPGTPRPLPLAAPRAGWCRVVPGSCDVPEAAGERPAAPGARAEAAADLLAEPRAVWPPQPGGRPGLFITGGRTRSFPLPLRRPWVFCPGRANDIQLVSSSVPAPRSLRLPERRAAAASRFPAAGGDPAGSDRSANRTAAAPARSAPTANRAAPRGSAAPTASRSRNKSALRASRGCPGAGSRSSSPATPPPLADPAAAGDFCARLGRQPAFPRPLLESSARCGAALPSPASAGNAFGPIRERLRGNAPAGPFPPYPPRPYSFPMPIPADSAMQQSAPRS